MLEATKTKDFDLKKLSPRQTEIYEKLTNFEFWNKKYCLGYVNSKGVFELSKKAISGVNNDDEGHTNSTY